jgi:type IV secretory pathway TraG/TraD family ATPase VirD4
MKSFNRAVEWCHRIISPDPRAWPGRLPLLRWNGWRPFTIGHSLEHVLAFGVTGSGKTSAGIKDMALAMLHAGYGVLFLSAKTTDPAEYYEWAKLAGREKSVVHFGPRHSQGFNLLEYELKNGGKLEWRTMNIPAIFSAVGEIITRNEKARIADGGIWEKASELLLKHAVSVVLLATGKLELDDIVEVVNTAPTSLEQANSKAWQRESICHQLLVAAETRNKGEQNMQRVLQLDRKYFLHQWPTFHPEGRQSVYFTFVQLANFFQSDPLHRMFFGKTDFTPDILPEGAVLIVDAPALAGGDQGKVLNGLLRQAVERMALQRTIIGEERPVAIIWDEFQTSVTRADSDFAAVARSHRCALVLATQNLNTVEAVMGRSGARTLFGNCRTKLFFANDDPDTNQYMADVISKWPVKKTSKKTDPEGQSSRTENPTQDEYAVPPRVALTLKSGGKDFKHRVTGIMVHAGHELTKKQPWLAVNFNQNAPVWRWPSPLRRITGAIGWRRPAPDFRWLR